MLDESCGVKGAVEARLSNLRRLPDDVAAAWSTIYVAITTAAKKDVDYGKHCGKPCLTEFTRDILSRKSADRLKGDIAVRNKLKKIFRVRAKIDQEIFRNRIADKEEIGIQKMNPKEVYNAIKCQNSNRKHASNTPVNKEGRLTVLIGRRSFITLDGAR